MSIDLDPLVGDAAAGSHAAFEQLVELCQDEVRFFVAARACNEHQMEEICQSAWVEVYQHLADYRGGGSFCAWVKGFARNLLSKDHARRRRDRARQPLALSELEELLTDNPGRVADERLDGDLRRCLERLPPADRKLIEARHFEEVPLPLMAQRFRRSVPTLTTALWRIRTALRRCLEFSA